MELIACNQFFESKRFQSECGKVRSDLKHRDSLIRAKNRFGLNPPWYTTPTLNDHERPLLGNTESRAWAPVYPSTPSLSPIHHPRPQTPPPIQDRKDADPTWNLQDDDLYCQCHYLMYSTVLTILKQLSPMIGLTRICAI